MGNPQEEIKKILFLKYLELKRIITEVLASMSTETSCD